jgi:prepilin-type N-terminal cleavage/methylation domain-containing protein
MIRRRAFTLLELVVATSLLAIAVSMVSLNMGGLSEQALAQSAALRLRALYRLGEAHAARTGRPCLLACGTEACTLRSLVFDGGGWRWQAGPAVELPSGIRLLEVNGNEPNDGLDADWSIPVSPGVWGSRVRLTLGARSGWTQAMRIGAAPARE